MRRITAQALFLIVVLIIMMCSVLPLHLIAQTEKEFLSIWGGSLNDIGEGVFPDSYGNVYVTGFTGSFVGSDSFLLKYNPTGNLLWQRAWGARQGCGGIGGDDVVDSKGNIIVVGTCDNGTFLLNFDSEGNLRWQTSLAGVGQLYSYGESVALDSSNNIYVVGGTELHLELGHTEFYDNRTLLLKYNSTGSLLWQTAWRAGADSRGYGVTVAPSSGDVYVTGAIGFGSEGTVITGFGPVEALILKFNSTGQLIWQKTWTGSELVSGVVTGRVTYGVSAVVDHSGMVYVLGDLGVSPFEEGPFLLKLDPQGNLMWQRNWRGGVDYGYGVALDSGGNIYITGEGHIVPTSANPQASGYARVVILRVSAAGDLTGDLASGTETADSYHGIGNKGIDLAVSNSGYVYVTGYVTEVPPYHVTFDNFAGSDHNLSSFGSSFGLQTPNNSTVLANFTSNSPNVGVFTPPGNTTYTANRDVFLAKYDAALKGSSTIAGLPTELFLIGAGVATAVSGSAVVAILLRRRHKFSATLRVKTA